MNLCFGLGQTTRRSRVTIDEIDVSIGRPSCEVDSAGPQIVIGLHEAMVTVECDPEAAVTVTNDSQMEVLV